MFISRRLITLHSDVGEPHDGVGHWMTVSKLRSPDWLKGISHTKMKMDAIKIKTT